MFSNNLLMAAASASGGGGYEVENSVRLNDDDSAYMVRTMGTYDSNTTGTISLWFKQANFPTSAHLFSIGSPSHTRVYIDAGVLYIGDAVDYRTTMLLRDPTSWYNLVVKIDTTDGTAGDRVIPYLNGVEITAFSTETNPGSSANMFPDSENFYIGSYVTPSNYWDGYISQFAFIDGTALDHTSFGEFDDEGEWRPKEIDETFGANGFLQTYSKSDHFGYNAAISNSFDVSGVTGVSNELTRGADLTGAADGEEMTFSCWFRVTAGDAATQVFLYSNGAVVNMQRATNNKLWVGVSGTPGFGFYSDSTYVAGSGWHHMIVSAKTTSGDTAIHLYVDGADDGSTGSITGTGNMDLTHSDWGVMGTDAAGSNLQGDMAEAWYAQEYIDVSSAPNLARFITTGGLPVDLGSDGSTPTGTAPLLYHHLNEDEATSGFVSNAGTGGTMTLGGSTLVESAIEPRYNVDFTDSGLTAADQVTDTPTDNFCVPNSVWIGTNTTSGKIPTYSNGNLTLSYTNAQGCGTISNLSLTTGKWYWEFTIDAGGNNSNYNICSGIVDLDVFLGANTAINGNQSGEAIYNSYTQILREDNATATDYGSTPGINTDVLQCALDLDNGAIYFGKNGSWFGSGDPTSGASRTGAGTTWTPGAKYERVAIACSPDGGSVPIMTMNFGQTAFNTSAPTDYLAISTANMTALTFDPADHHQVELVNHDGSSTSFTLNWDADTYDTLFIIKNRDSSEKWFWVNGLDGYDKYLSSDDETALTTDANVLGVSATTITLGSSAALSADNYIIECHRAGAAGGASNGDGSITSTVSNNSVTDFSIVQYTGNGSSGATVGLGLANDPGFHIVKQNDAASTAWHIWSPGLSDNTKYLRFTSAVESTGNSEVPWKNTAPTASVMTLGNTATWLNDSGDDFTVFTWAPVEGYSAFGSYGGNGDALGPVINTGVSPSSTLLKKIAGAANNWTYIHEARDTYNASANGLRPDLTNAEQGSASGQDTDQLSTGMKIRNANNQMNTSGTDNYIYGMWGTPTVNKSETPAKAR